MGYLEASLSLNPSDREPKATIVARAMLGTVLTTAAELAQAGRPTENAVAIIAVGWRNG